MADSTKSALDFLHELRRERDELNALIQAIEKRLEVVPAQSVISSDGEKETPSQGRYLGRFKTRDSAIGSALTVGFFHNMSQAAAAEKLMKLNPNHALTTRQILEAFKSSGMPLNPKNAVQILYTALTRNPKFERVGNKAWGLREWYPEKKKRTTSDRNLPDPDNLPDHNPIMDEEEGEGNTNKRP